MCQDIVRIDVQNPIQVRKGRFEIPQLGQNEAMVVEGKGVAGLILQDSVEVCKSLTVIL